MKIRNKITVLATCMLLITATACEDFLDNPLNGGVTSETFYKTDSDATQAVTVIYDILTWHENAWGWASPTFAKTLPSDEGTCGGGGDTDQPGYQQLDDFNYDASSQTLLAAWNVNYFGIYRANLVIDNVDPINDLRKRLVAEAKALRAYYYLELVAMWGDVPLILTELAPSEYNQPRVDKATVYAQIEQDLTDAIIDLPLKSEYASGDRFRVSKGTAQALLGKAHLYQEEYADAATQFSAVINSGEYGLEANFADILKANAEFGTESLLEASYSSTQGYNWGNYPWGGRHEDNVHIQLMGFRDRPAAGLGIRNGWGFNYPSTKLYDAYITEGDEERRLATVITQQEAYDGGMDTSGVSGLWDYDGLFRTKYGTYITETSASGVAELNYGTNWRLLRYADVLLMAAEAYHKNGQDIQAQNELNKVRARVSLPNVTATGTALFDAIVNERFLELAFEGFRYVDLIRWGLAEQELGSLGYQSKHGLWPIPESELAAASELVQNPGW